jgi:Uncharacterized conserved protein
MATIPTSKKIPPITINKFLGLNENPDGQFNLKLGEASKMINFRTTPNYQLKKREGYKTIFSGLTGNVQGMWYGRLNNTAFFLFCNNGHLYSGNLTDGTKTDLGTLPDAPTRFIPFGNKVYLNNGHEYKSFDGTTFATVQGYRPKIAITTPPAGGGTTYEQINILTGQKHQTFSPDGSSTSFQLAETSINSVDFVKINGVLKTAGTDYTVDLSNGKVNFTTAPTGGVPDSCDIGWTKGTGQRDLIEKCRFSMDYSGKSDSRVFLWGNQDYKNRRFWSGLADGVPSAEYFEANSFSDEGNGQYAITDMVKMDDTQKIFLENGTRYSNYETETVNNQVIASFPSYELSDEIGNQAFGQVQIVNNMPLSIYKGIYAWSNTNVRDQTNHKLISQSVQDSLDNVDLTTSITYNWQEKKEYWLNIGSIVWIWNYLNDTWYKFDNVESKCFIAINNELYFGTNGTIEKFDISERTDNNIAINAVWESGFNDFGAEYLTKFMNNIWVSINPNTKTSVDVQITTNNEGTKDKQTVYYSLSTFLHANFSHWSFATSYNPQPKYLEIQAYGFVYIKLILINNSTTDLVTILSINMPARYGGKVR